MGQEFTIKTDQISLKYLLEQRVNTPMQHKGLSKLLGLNYKIEYKRGVENKVANALSRKEAGEGKGVEAAAELSVVSVLVPRWVEDLKESYVGDDWVKELRSKMKDKEEKKK